MNHIEIELYFEDEEFSKMLFTGTPPDGIVAKAPLPTELNAIDATVTAHIAFNVTLVVSLPKATLVVLSGWVLKQFRANAKNNAKKTARINNVNVPLQEAEILAFIEKVLAVKHAQENERKSRHQKKLGD